MKILMVTPYAPMRDGIAAYALQAVAALRRAGEQVDVLSPGPTATELAKAALGEEGQKAYGMMTPLQRMADPAELGAVAAFLASDDSSFMTASEVAVDGGLVMM